MRPGVSIAPLPHLPHCLITMRCGLLCGPYRGAAGRAGPRARPRGAAPAAPQVACPPFRDWRAPVPHPRPGDVGSRAFRRAVRLDSAGARAGLHGVQLHGAAARGAASQRLCQAAPDRRTAARPGLCDSQRDLRDPVHDVASGPPCGTRVGRSGSEAASSLAEAHRPLVQAAVRDARALSDLLPCRPPGDGALCAGGAAHDRLGAARDDGVSAWARSPRCGGLLGRRRHYART